MMIQNEIKLIDFLHSFKTMIDQLAPEEQFYLDKTIEQAGLDMTEVKPKSKPSEHDEIKEKDEKSSQILIQKMDDLVASVISKKTVLNLDKEKIFISILIELILSKDQSLKTSALGLLSLLNSQNTTLGDTINNLQIIDDGNSKDHFDMAKQYSYTLNTIGDTIEKWYNNPESNEMAKLVHILNKIYKALLNIQRGESSMEIQADDSRQNELESPKKHAADHNTLQPNDNQNFKPFFKERRTRVTATYLDLKNNANLTDIHQYLLDSENEIIDIFEQDLFRNSGIYEGLEKMLEFDAEIDNLERSESNIIIIRKIYRILAKSSKGSIKNKEYLTRYLEKIILVHFQDIHCDLNSYFLVKKIVIDNKLILLDESKVKNLTNIILKM